MAVNLWQAAAVNANSALLWFSISAETAVDAWQPTLTCKQAIGQPPTASQNVAGCIDILLYVDMQYLPVRLQLVSLASHI